jgi:hypothetical protein
MLNDFEPTVRIPVRIHPNGQVTLLYKDVPLPCICQSGVGELCIPTIYLANQQWADLLSYTITETICDTGAMLYYKLRSMSLKAFLSLNKNRRDFCFQIDRGEPHVPDWFVQIILQEPLSITVTGTKNARLQQCSCWIPALDRVAISVNQAGRFISEVYESERHSHTINAFRDVYIAEEGRELYPLDDRRTTVESVYETLLIPRLDPDAENGLIDGPVQMSVFQQG